MTDDKLKKLEELKNQKEEVKNPSLRIQRFLTESLQAKAINKLNITKGEKGDPGYSPVKGKDYFTEADVLDVARKAQSLVKPGPKGDKGDFTIGAKGDTGPEGRPGRTPLREIDYWTATDRKKIIEEVVSKIPSAKDGISPSMEDIVANVRNSPEIKNIKELVSYLKLGGFRGGAGSGGSGSSITLKTNGVSNTSQTILNLIAGTNITLTADASGGVTIDASGGGSSQTLAQTLALGNITGANDLVVSTGQQIIGQTDLLLSHANGDNYYYAGPNYLFQQWDGGAGNTDFLLQGGGTQLFSHTAMDIQTDTGLYNFFSGTGTNYNGIFNFTNIATSNKTFTFPNNSGTIALTSDIPSLSGYIQGSGTINQISYFTASGTIASLTTATYPSLTELSYAKGVSSAIQTQLNAKGSGTVTAVSVASANGISGSSSGGATPALTIALGAIVPTTVNGLTITANGTNTLNIAAGKTLAVSNTLTLAGTDSTVMTFPTTSATIARTDAANTFTGVQTFSTPIATGSIATMTATVGGGVPTPPNNTTTFLRGDGSFAAPGGGGTSALVMYVQPPTPQGVTTADFVGNTVMSCGYIYLPSSITVNKVSIHCAAVNVAGTLKLSLFSTDGQTQYFSVTTASISTSGVKTTAVGSVALSAGYYYFTVLAQTTADISLNCYTGEYCNSVTSEPIMSGQLTVTANTVPATFTPGSISSYTSSIPVARLDN